MLCKREKVHIRGSFQYKDYPQRNYCEKFLWRIYPVETRDAVELKIALLVSIREFSSHHCHAVVQVILQVHNAEGYSSIGVASRGGSQRIPGCVTARP